MYTRNTVWPVPEEHMVMGVKDAEISQMVLQADGTTYSIYGDNFTKQSKVYINGEKQTTKFLNNTRLDLKDSQIEDGDTVMWRRRDPATLYSENQRLIYTVTAP